MATVIPECIREETEPVSGGVGLRLVNVVPRRDRMDGLRCAQCGEIIGAYEPMSVILGDGSRHAGSRLSLDVLLGKPDSIAVHEGCDNPDADCETGQSGGAL